MTIFYITLKIKCISFKRFPLILSYFLKVSRIWVKKILKFWKTCEKWLFLVKDLTFCKHSCNSNETLYKFLKKILKHVIHSQINHCAAWYRVIKSVFFLILQHIIRFLIALVIKISMKDMLTKVLFTPPKFKNNSCNICENIRRSV